MQKLSTTNFFQRYLGNSYMQSIAGSQNSSGLATSWSSVPTVQRKCSCGGSCSSLVSEEEVTGKIQTQPSFNKDQSLQCTVINPGTINAIQLILNGVLESRGGRPLDEPTRAFMESRFGYDFSHVRIHTDSRAAESARKLGALAFTVGRHIMFGQGQYKPEIQSGRKLIAHELAHVMQQHEGSSPAIHSSNEANKLENEADQAAQMVVTDAEKDLLVSQTLLTPKGQIFSSEKGDSPGHLAASVTHPGVLLHRTGRMRGESLLDCINRHLGQHGILTHIGWTIIAICGLIAVIASGPAAVFAACLCIAFATGIEVGTLFHCVWDCR